jgi:hypothetical protein
MLAIPLDGRTIRAQVVGEPDGLPVVFANSLGAPTCASGIRCCRCCHQVSD